MKQPVLTALITLRVFAFGGVNSMWAGSQSSASSSIPSSDIPLLEGGRSSIEMAVVVSSTLEEVFAAKWVAVKMVLVTERRPCNFFFDIF